MPKQKSGPVVYTVRTHSYPGDNTVQVRIKDPARPHAAYFVMFNLYRRRYGHLGLMYENDRFSHDPFKTIAEAKEYALKAYKKGVK